MKRFVLLIILIKISFSAFSQTTDLKPRVHQTPIDTLFCFTLDQSRAIAKVLESSRFQDSLIVQWKILDQRNRQLLKLRDSSIVVLNQRIQHHKLIESNQEQSILLLQSTIQVQERAIKNHKRHKTWMSVGLGLLTLALFIN